MVTDKQERTKISAHKGREPSGWLTNLLFHARMMFTRGKTNKPGK